jgi:hypothetical protein
MSFLGQMSLMCFLAFLAWRLYTGIKNNPGAFSRVNLGRSAWTMGILALMLIALVGFAAHSLK